MALALSGDILFSGLVSGYGLRLHLVGYSKHLHLVSQFLSQKRRWISGTSEVEGLV